MIVPEDGPTGIDWWIWSTLSSSNVTIWTWLALRSGHDHPLHLRRRYPSSGRAPRLALQVIHPPRLFCTQVRLNVVDLPQGARLTIAGGRWGLQLRAWALTWGSAAAESAKAVTYMDALAPSQSTHNYSAVHMGQRKINEPSSWDTYLFSSIFGTGCSQ